MIFTVACESLNASIILSRFPDKITIPAEAIAVLDAFAKDTPTLAAVMLGTSFTPSPTKAIGFFRAQSD